MWVEHGGVAASVMVSSYTYIIERLYEWTAHIYGGLLFLVVMRFIFWGRKYKALQLYSVIPQLMQMHKFWLAIVVNVTHSISPQPMRWGQSYIPSWWPTGS